MEHLSIKKEVKDALKAGKAVVALESTIIAHGMPYPENVETALELEDIIRNEGAIPATIAIINGEIKIGLTEAEIKMLGQAKNVRKVSRRDYPVVLAEKGHGATTVAGTMIAASLAGIKIFVTGGIGGVHRGAAETFDISADLQELNQTDVVVVSAGVKSILDIGLTLERLETLGVPVLGYQTDEFPAFYTRQSGFAVDKRVDRPATAAAIIKAKYQLGLSGGILIANPVPHAAEIDPELIDAAIQSALSLATKKNVSGKKLTPFLLDKIKEITKGKSLTTNIGLVRHNAKVGAQIAVALTAI